MPSCRNCGVFVKKQGLGVPEERNHRRKEQKGRYSRRQDTVRDLPLCPGELVANETSVVEDADHNVPRHNPLSSRTTGTSAGRSSCTPCRSRSVRLRPFALGSGNRRSEEKASPPPCTHHIPLRAAKSRRTRAQRAAGEKGEQLKPCKCTQKT